MTITSRAASSSVRLVLSTLARLSLKYTDGPPQGQPLQQRGRSWAVPAKVRPVRPPVEGSQVRAAGLIRGTPSGPDRISAAGSPAQGLGARQVGRVCSGHCNLITGGTLRDRCLTASARPPGRIDQSEDRRSSIFTAVCVGAVDASRRP